ncbi:transposase, partial [Microcoleus sp. PH2017_24_DOB_U_A]|uniref:RNA-guided endonuclease InsQ/TnpB family protein n=1 Tax=Microcoleus sp. PH2017_24_DOB_U_A TaxID=2798834 RepID=UPI00345A129E
DYFILEILLPFCRNWVKSNKEVMQVFNLTYEFKLKPTKTQVAIFEDWLEQCRKVYNYALQERKDWYNSRKCRIDACSLRSEFIIRADTPRPTYSTQCKALTAYRKTSPALQRINAQALQQVLRRLEKAFVSMWEQNHGFPRFKKRGTMRSFVFPQLSLNPIQNSSVKLPVIGWVRFWQSRAIPDGGIIKQARVVNRASGWYLMLTVTNFIATSNSLLVKRPRFFIDAERKLKLLQKRVSKKRSGSNNWRKAQKKVALLHEYVANCRKDWHRKISHQICNDVGMVFVEDLNLVGLSRGMLGKHCLDAGWGQFFTILEQTCWKRGVYFQKVNAKKTSQICPNCGVATGKKELAERTHTCSNCGYTTDRDVAAAQVVLIRGLAAVGHTVKMLAEGKFVGIPLKQESSRL